jgi:peptidoglycan/LPS O-acetylase OafA/YrhL
MAIMTQDEQFQMIGSSYAMPATASKSNRIVALDFTKGALVLLMVLYHWLNYFISTEGEFYRYLRFITPSFIFITGFLISNMYLSKYDLSDPKLTKRLFERGLKILGVFIIINLAVGYLISESYSGNIIFHPLSAATILAIYVTGNVAIAGVGKAAVFQMLVPISYLLLLSAGLMIACKFYKKYFFYALCATFLLCILIMVAGSFKSMNLDLITFGLLGVVIGHIPLENINTIVKYPYALVGAYLCYLIAITVWNVIYPLQIVGVCLSLTILYMLGTSNGEPGRMRRQILLLGRYSLFGYIAQIAILQLLFRIPQHVNLGAGVFVISFFGAFFLTILSVQAVDWARTRSTIMDWLYKAVFA